MSLEQTWKGLNIKFVPHSRDRKSSFHVRQIVALFRKLVALILSQNCVKGLRVPKTFTEINLKGVWGK